MHGWRCFAKHGTDLVHGGSGVDKRNGCCANLGPAYFLLLLPSQVGAPRNGRSDITDRLLQVGGDAIRPRLVRNSLLLTMAATRGAKVWILVGGHEAGARFRHILQLATLLSQPSRASRAAMARA